MNTLMRVIPAPKGLWEICETDDCTETRLPVVAFGLFQRPNGGAELMPMSIDGMGDVSACCNDPGFCRIEWDKDAAKPAENGKEVKT